MNGVEQRRIQSRLLDEELDDDMLKSSKEIRSQIEAVKADARRCSRFTGAVGMAGARDLQGKLQIHCHA
jgi:hypothetical protein